MTLLKIAGLTKQFGGLLAVDHVNLEIDAGTAVSIVGPNGSGKSTLFNLITGVYSSDQGTIIFDGREVTQLPSYRRAHLGIGRTFQIPRPFGSLTVRENVAIGAMFGTEEGRRTVEEALVLADEQLKRINFYDRRDRRSGELTPTEMKMMEIARALAMRPKLLLLDEAMAGMPPKGIDAVVELLNSIKREEQISIVAMVEHIMRAVVSFAEKVIVLYQGAKLIEAPPEEALSDPRVVDVYLGREATD